MAPIQPERPSVALYISEVSALSHGPSMGLQRFDGPPASIEPDEARRLAAALLKGAEIVEGARTAMCPVCQRPVVPAELEDRPDCFQCEAIRCAAERKSRRASMNVIRPMGPTS
jgi:hypothetical protein